MQALRLQSHMRVAGTQAALPLLSHVGEGRFPTASQRAVEHSAGCQDIASAFAGLAVERDVVCIRSCRGWGPQRAEQSYRGLKRYLLQLLEAAQAVQELLSFVGSLQGSLSRVL